MNLFFDVAVIAVLLGVALGHVPGSTDGAAAAWAAALAPCWLAVVTPALVRSDVTRRRLPNAFTVPAVGLAVVGAAGEWAAGGGGHDPALALGLVVVCIVVGGVASARGGVGLGDVKLAAGLVGSLALVAPEALPTSAVVTGLAGMAGVLGSRFRARVRSPIRRSTRSQGGMARGSPTIPYGPCLLAGYWVGLASSGMPVWRGAGAAAALGVGVGGVG